MCEHLRNEVRRRIISNGTRVCCRQCLDCFKNLGFVVRADYEWDLLEWFDLESRTNYWEQMRETIKQDKQQHYEAPEEVVSWWDVYSKHIQSDKWFALRAKVLERDNFICQGCLSNKADHAHHKSYKNMGNEFAFELISLCKDCHSRWHNKPVGTNSELNSIIY